MIEVPSPDDIKRARFEKGISQGDLADAAGISQPMLSRIERDDVDPSLSTVQQIADALNDQ